MHIIILFLGLLILTVGPGLWVKAVIARYSRPVNRYSQSGGELSRYLLDTLNLEQVKTEITNVGDHYDPIKKAVRLTEANFNGHSLAAITIAAHEVGHAIQDAKGFKPLKWRTKLVKWVGPVEKIGAGILMVAPFTAALTRAPSVGIIMLLGGFLTLGSGVAVHFLTLPTEFDASFRRALPLLSSKKLLHQGDETGARTLLTAAALTYVAGSLASLLNIARWWAILKR
ncbi:MAG: peptidase [Rhodospirillaceae bacterium]|nr:peptidase [Rhodospirillaceae bacterium]|tara:strand:- start:1622 stop:2305 length:684 start_codon:yes stop_codon:yes gene_type:complete